MAAVARLREAFTACFDNQVSEVIVNELPTDFKTLRYIRNLLAVERIDHQALITIETGITEMENLLKIIQVYFLPRAKELLRVSYLKPEQMVTGKDVYVLRRLALTALPQNLARLSKITRELKDVLAPAA